MWRDNGSVRQVLGELGSGYLQYRASTDGLITISSKSKGIRNKGMANIRAKEKNASDISEVFRLC